MPEVFKGIFTCDDKGEHIQLISPAVVRKKIEDFMQSEGCI